MADDSSRYKAMAYSVLVPGIIFSGSLGLFSFHEGEVLLAFLDFLLFLILFSLLILIRGEIGLRVIVVILQALLMGYFLYFFAFGLARHQTYLWYYVIPPLSFFFFGRLKGGLLSMGMLMVSVLIVVFHKFFPFFPSYPPGALVRFFSSYLAVSIMIYIFESSRLQTKRELESALRKLQDEAIRDGLTELYNRRYMDNVLDLVLRQRQEDQVLAFLMADLDFFKQYNDTYGHQAGDRALQAFAGLLLSLKRRKTDYVFRYGGEEFAILLSFTSVETAEDFSDRIVKATESLSIPHSKSLGGTLTVSVGATFLSGRKNVDKTALIQAADDALYEAKEGGRNCFRVMAVED